MASIPLAVVLVAALVVPLAAVPGTFGFHSWPTSRGEQVTDRPVRQAARGVQVVESRPERRASSSRSLAVAKQSRDHGGATRVPATAAPTAPRRQAATVVAAPGRVTHGGGRGPGRSPAPAAPSTTGQTPASEGEPPAQQPAADAPAPQLANGEAPVRCSRSSPSCPPRHCQPCPHRPQRTPAATTARPDRAS
jgi:hypothetical protein